MPKGQACSADFSLPYPLSPIHGITPQPILDPVSLFLQLVLSVVLFAAFRWAKGIRDS